MRVHVAFAGDIGRQIAGEIRNYLRGLMPNNLDVFVDIDSIESGTAWRLATFADAIHVGRACDEAGCYWFEDPMMDAGWSPHAARQLKAHVKTPLLLTEHVRGLEPKAVWITERATDFLRTDRKSVV